jgi:hypothetical protein
MRQRAVVCECYQLVPVSEDAGPSVKCSCGRYVIVPPTAEFADSPVLISGCTLENRVRRLLALGQLPPSRECAWCGAPEAQPFDIRLVCEESEARATGGEHIVWIPGLLWVYSREGEGVAFYGCDNTVPVPLCACQNCAEKLRAPKDLVLPRFPLALFTTVAAAVIAVFAPIVALLAALLVFLTVFVMIPRRYSLVLRRWDEGVKERLNRVSIYAQLLTEYPFAVVMVVHAPAVPERGNA